MRLERSSQVIFVLGYDLWANGWVQQSTWYRVIGPGQALTRAGFDVQYAYAHESERIACLLKAGAVRWMILHRVGWSAGIGQNIDLARSKNCKVSWDADDNIISPEITEDSPFLRHFPPDQKQAIKAQAFGFVRVMKSCDNALLSTPELAELARVHQPCSITSLNAVPDFYLTQDDASERDFSFFQREGQFTVFYGPGSTAHQYYLKPVEKALMRMFSVFPETCLVLGGGLHLPASLRRYRERIILLPNLLPWVYFQVLQRAHLSLAPLQHDSYARCKSEIKALEPAFQGTPWVGSDVSTYRRIHESTRTGLLVKDDEWFDAFAEMIGKRESYAEKAQSRRGAVRKLYSWDSRLTDYIDLCPS